MGPDPQHWSKGTGFLADISVHSTMYTLCTLFRSNKPGMHLLHYVAGQVEVAQPDLLSITDDLNILEEASK